MFHVWFIPVLLLLVVGVLGLYLLLKFTGGSGERTPGRTLVDEQRDEADLPPD